MTGSFFVPEAIAVAASTGGPQALLSIFQSMPLLRQPVFIVQHMPALFTPLLAEQIGQQSARDCREACDGEMVKAGGIYLAPGARNMAVARGAGNAVRIRLDEPGPECLYMPSADVLLESLARSYQGKVLAIILTGMGTDGLIGCRAVAATGGRIIAQDEASSVVWGMPGHVVREGLANHTLPLADIVPLAARYALKGRAA